MSDGAHLTGACTNKSGSISDETAGNLPEGGGGRPRSEGCWDVKREQNNQATNGA